MDSGTPSQVHMEEDQYISREYQFLWPGGRPNARAAGPLSLNADKVLAELRDIQLIVKKIDGCRAWLRAVMIRF